ncbi:MAG TPA: hypothetical protein VGM37_07725 [Armatimonadota bacterium]|jgi:hypothetical protein
MRNHDPVSWKGARLALSAALLTLPLLAAQAAPTVDGVLDADYGAPIASSPKDNLLVDATASPAINDPALPAARANDITGLYVTNTGNALYIYIQLPYFSFATATGNFAITMHLGGANDSLAMPALSKDPYTGTVFYNYTSASRPEPNVVLISNVKSTSANGWAYLMRQGSSGSYNYDNTYGDIFSISNVAVTAASTSVHSIGPTGAEIAYAAGDGTVGGIEIKLPFSMFSQTGVLSAPAVGDTVKLQVYDTITGRAAIDSAPFEAGARVYQDPGAPAPDYGQGFLTEWASYTIQQVGTPLEVLLAKIVDSTHVGLKFTDNLSTGATGGGAGNLANYAVVDLDNNNAVLPVTSAAVESGDPTIVDLGFASLPLGHHIRLTANNVQSASGVSITPSKNVTDYILPVLVTFEICDNSAAGLVNGKAVSLTGNFLGWTQGAGKEVDLTLESGSTTCYKSAPTWVTPGAIEYKYRLDYSDWDTMNKRNHKFTVPASSPVEIQDVIGGPVTVTFDLTLYPDKTIPAGSTLYVTGDWNGFSTDPLSATPPLAMTLVPGKTNEYTATLQTTQNVWEYKYILIDSLATVDWTSLNADNRSVYVKGAGTPLTQTVIDTAGTPLAQLAARVLRIAGGLEAAPASTDSIWAVLDKTGDSKITVEDAVKLLHP